MGIALAAGMRERFQAGAWLAASYRRAFRYVIFEHGAGSGRPGGPHSRAAGLAGRAPYSYR